MKSKYLLVIAAFVVAVLGLFTIQNKLNTNKVHELPIVANNNATSVNPVANQVKHTALNASVNANKVATVTASSWVKDEVNAIEPQATNLNDNVLKLSLRAYQHAEKMGVTNSPVLTIIDYSKPSAQRRLWVVDLSTKKVLFNTLVAHGKNSGMNTSTSFSNTESSLKSSIGVFVTDKTYIGKHGQALRIRGLESGVNSNAYDRSIVFHGADYVSESLAQSSGRIGRSWGCPAVSNDVINPLVKTIKNKTVVFAYYPDKKWLNNSTFLSNI